MFDAHYDLLTICLLDQHFQSHYLKQHCACFGKNNITGVFANLYFMKKKMMQEQWHIRSKTPDVLTLFKKSKQLLLQQNLPIDILYSIEGCDYIKDEKELEQLHKAGLNSILLVWNHANRYGGGAFSNKGLTKICTKSN